MTSRAVSLLAAIVLAVVFLCVGGLTAISGTAATACLPPPSAGTTSGQYDAEQIHYATVIATTGAQRRISVRGQVIAVATAIQESRLRNLPDQGAANDHDSLGLFQQRPSQGWGTPEQIMDPVYATNRFYDKLLQVPGWEQLPLTEAAQAVQRSAFPDAYAKWETDATMLVGLAGTATAPSDSATTVALCAATGEWMKPVNGTIVSGFRTESRPGHQGSDIAAARGTPIHAASTGQVIRVRCNAHLGDGTSYSCDIDGSPSVLGCGWYVEIAHPDGTVTRYCHMLHRPDVNVGESVIVGQIIGAVGSSGNSSGPHLHFETHLGRPATSANAVDPVAFMSIRGVAL